MICNSVLHLSTYEAKRNAVPNDFVFCECLSDLQLECHVLTAALGRASELELQIDQLTNPVLYLLCNALANHLSENNMICQQLKVDQLLVTSKQFKSCHVSATLSIHYDL